MTYLQNLRYFTLSEKNWERGVKLVLLAQILRLVQRYFLTFHMKSWLPEILIHQIPTYPSPLELWSSPWSEIFYLLAICLCILISYAKSKRVILIPILMLLNIFDSFGGETTGKSMVLLQPVLLLITLMELFRNSPYWKKYGSFSILMFLAVMYFFNGLTKTGPEWQNGTAVAKFLTSNVWSFGLDKPSDSYLLVLLNNFIIYWELAGIILILPLASRCSHWIRLSYGTIALLFHGFLFLFTPLKALSLASMGLWLMIWPEKNLVTVENDFLPEKKYFLKLVMALWTLFLIIPNLLTLGFQPIPGPVLKVLVTSSLYPQWRLFSPSPFMGKLTGELHLPDGRKIIAEKYHPELSFMGNLLFHQSMWDHVIQRFCKTNEGEMKIMLFHSKRGRRLVEEKCQDARKRLSLD